MAEYRSFRAPRENLSRLCDPELDQIASIIHENRSRFAVATCSWMDIPLATVRQWAREETLVQGMLFTQDYLPELPLSKNAMANRDLLSSPPLIASGHQPELFHSGVWFKNFLLSALAERHSGIGVNIQVDHDLARKFSMSVPSLSQDGLISKETISIDEDRPVLPWEVTRISNLSAWESFPSEVIARLNSAGIEEPILDELWPKVIAALKLGRPLGEALSTARHRVEHSVGLRTIELPFSRLASERSFACFVGELLTRIETVHETYNTERLRYRLHHRIKNHLQPLPALARDGLWLESPFWVYSARDPVRRSLWVMRDKNHLRLSDRKEWQVDFPSHRNFEDWYRGWCELKTDAVSIRPRALTTTAFLRLAVADLFIHGIGGGKYDQMTDEIVRSLWDFLPPRYLVSTATLHLPLLRSERQGNSNTEAEIWRRIRDWRFSPERLCNKTESTPGLKDLLLEKSQLLQQMPARREKPDWHQKIQRVNGEIRKHLHESEESLQDSLLDAHHITREMSVRASREFSFTLFPMEWIVPRLTKLCKEGSRSDISRVVN